MDLLFQDSTTHIINFRESFAYHNEHTYLYVCLSVLHLWYTTTYKYISMSRARSIDQDEILQTLPCTLCHAGKSRTGDKLTKTRRDTSTSGVLWLGCSSCTGTQKLWFCPYLLWLQAHRQPGSKSGHLPTTKNRRPVSLISWRKSFITLDLTHAYQQIKLEEESRKYVTMNTYKGLLQYIRLPFGVASAPAVFQQSMENLL